MELFQKYSLQDLRKIAKSTEIYGYLKYKPEDLNHVIHSHFRVIIKKARNIHIKHPKIPTQKHIHVCPLIHLFMDFELNGIVYNNLLQISEKFNLNNIHYIYWAHYFPPQDECCSYVLILVEINDGTFGLFKFVKSEDSYESILYIKHDIKFITLRMLSHEEFLIYSDEAVHY
jgi:hypothetical protein